MHHTTVDFETFGIEDRPGYPPEPVGVAIRSNRGVCKYMAWGHKEENNCTKSEARNALLSIWGKPLIFHNAAFDMEVGVERLDLPVPVLWEDTLLLAFLDDPRRNSLSLKPMAESILNIPPDEQQELKDWIIENYMKPRGLKKYSQWGAYIAYAPGKLVGKYAKGDVDRTYKLFRHFYPIIESTGMLPAYHRERRIIGIKLDMERPGIRIAPKLKKEHSKWKRAQEGVETAIKKNLRLDFNINSPKQLADALVKRKKLNKIVKTPKGSVSTKREVLEENCNDPNLIQLLAFNGILGTYIGTFIEPWIRSAEINEGLIYPSFNTVRSTDEYGRGGVGTRTGRFSSSRPNFQNIPTDVEGSKHEDVLVPLQKYLKGYGIRFVGLRDYIVPRTGRMFIARDYAQQELRILAHYEDDYLLKQYQANPNLDIHDLITNLIHARIHILYPRKFVKEVVFSIIYGKGIRGLSKKLKISKEEAARLREAVYAAVPGLKELQKELDELCRKEKPIYTWGGRRYYAEEDRWIKVKGEWRKKKYWYKMLNLLIQGSAADATKQGMINVSENVNSEYTTMLVQVHDELLFEVDKDKTKAQDKLIKEAMENLSFDVPMPTDAKYGARSWGRLK